MSRKRSAETRQRISEGMKYMHAQKREKARLEADPVAHRVKIMKDSFSKGSGVEDARVRNYGSIGPDAVRPSPGDVAANLVPETKGEQVHRSDQVKVSKEGERYKPSAPVPVISESMRKRVEIQQKRMESKSV